MAGYDSTEPYDGRVRFTEPITAGYDMMMVMPTKAYVLKVYVYICMYHVFHVSSPQRYPDVTGCIFSIPVYITVLTYAFLPHILSTLFVLTSFLFVDAACRAAGPDRQVDVAPPPQ